MRCSAVTPHYRRSRTQQFENSIEIQISHVETIAAVIYAKSH